ncbi:MAG: amino acid adenylation domain-containing protein [Gammaproteobacteria bacterium]|nr:amino acid adenylation domain-containing protein [Gammaproteobacteria bacterium]
MADLRDHTLSQAVERHARERPHARAVSAAEVTLDYAGLNARANRVAAALRVRGACAGERVGVCLPRGVDWIATLLAVLKTGAAYLPLDPGYPAQRLARIAARGRPGLLVTSGDVDSDWRTAYPTLHLERDAAAIEAASAADVANTSAPGDACYIVFTSGSTGEPKGVVVTHANVARLFDDLGAVLGRGPGEVWSQIHSSAFGFSIFEIWGALGSGGELAIAPAAVRGDAREMRNYLRRSGVTILSQTPSAWRSTALSTAFDGAWAETAVRALVLSGEAVRGDDLVAWSRGAGPRPRLLNTYAITETGGNVMLRQYADGDIDAANIGKPLTDVSLHVLDASGLPVAPGGEGELAVSGPGVAQGYLDDEALTAERFLRIAPGTIAYRTGDRVCLRPDGSVEFRGRTDDQVKWRGHRLELGEIETLLRSHPAVAEAAAAVRADAGGEEKLVAYVVAGTDGERSHERPEFWPSLGGYQVYDDFLYELMTSDARRVEAHRVAFERQARGKVVLDVGTGPHALLARLAVAAGARHVHAIELLPDAAAQARAAVAAAGLADRITVLTGDAATVELPEPAEVCAQGIVGNIGSADGIVPVWNSLWPRLARGVIPVPARCTTWIAPVELPASLRDAPAFGPIAARYLRRLFESQRRVFDPRLCVRNLPTSCLLASPALFEDLDFSGPLPVELAGRAGFSAQRDGRFDGFLLWTVVTTIDGVSIDYLAHQQAWLPVFIPLPVDPPDIGRGTRIEADWERRSGADSVCPDYRISAALEQGGSQLRFRCESRHHETVRGGTPLHQRLLAAVDCEPVQRPPLEPGSLRGWLAERLPEPLLPNALILLDALPRTPNGKLDRRALPTPERTWGGHGGAPETALESDLAAIWSEVLGAVALGVQDNFFDLGGDSVAAVRMTTRLQKLLDDGVMLAAVFEAPTIAALSRYLHERHAQAVGRLYGPARSRSGEQRGAGEARRKHGDL